MTGGRICAGYYRRYDGKVVYEVSLATDADTGEETVVWIAYPFADVPSEPFPKKRTRKYQKKRNESLSFCGILVYAA